MEGKKAHCGIIPLIPKYTHTHTYIPSPILHGPHEPIVGGKKRKYNVQGRSYARQGIESRSHKGTVMRKQ